MAFVKKNETGSKTIVKGFLTGGIEAAICYPTEFIKTQLQLQSKTKPEFKGMMDCAQKTVARHGPMGLYRGAAPLILGSGFKQMARWGAYNNISAVFRDKDDKLSVPMTALCGLCAGVVEACVAVTPIETLKTRVTDDQRRGTKRYSGSFDAVKVIFRSEGPMGLYMGLTPTILKQGTNQLTRMPIQVLCCDLLTGGNKELLSSPVYNGIAGAMAGAISVLITMPQDTIKTRMQGENAKKDYKGFVDCAKQVIQKEGFAQFYAGTWPRLIRVSLDVGITFAIYPLITQLLNRAYT